MQTTPKVVQFSIHKGEVREQGPCMALFEDKFPPLYILTEPTGGPGEDACQLAAATVNKTFRSRRLSLTSSLAAALQAAHEQRVAENKLSLPEHRVGLIMTCVTVRGSEVYIAQAGPAVAYAFGKGRLHRFVPEGAAEAKPLGFGEKPPVQVKRYLFRGGDVLLLASSNLSRLTSLEGLTALMQTEPSRLAGRLYTLAKEEANFSALLLHMPIRPVSYPSQERFPRVVENLGFRVLPFLRLGGRLLLAAGSFLAAQGKKILIAIGGWLRGGSP